MDPVNALRQVKHRAFVMSKRARWLAADAHVLFEDVQGRFRERWGAPYSYDAGRYPRTFLQLPEPAHEEGRRCPRVIYTVWFGGALPPRRRASLDALRRLNEDSDVVLITESNMGDYLVPGHPLHPAFPKLAATHRSDHLRAYLMHFHGGGYSDLKTPHASWADAFDFMTENPSITVTGYREITSNYVTDNVRALGKDLRKYYRFVIGPSAFIMRPGSAFTASLYREQLRRMDYCLAALTDTPPPNPYELPASYPLWWAELFPDIAQCLSLKYQENIRFDDRLRPRMRDYR